MASTEVKFRRGSTAEHAAFTGAAGEMTVDTTKKVPVVHDGSTPGGFPALGEAAKDTDTALTANSDDKVPSQKAAKAYADTKIPSSYLDTDTALSANSDTKVATQKATKAYADSVAGIPTSYLDTDGAMAADSDTKVPSQKATRTYVGAAIVAFLSTLLATEEDPGLVELSTAAEAVTGTDEDKAVTPAGLAAALGAQAPKVRVATTGNITISTALNPGDTIDGVTLSDGDWVLVKDQSAAAQNGIYAVAASPARVPILSAFNSYPGILVAVQEGTVNEDTLWSCTADKGGVIDTTALTFERVGQDYLIKVLSSDDSGVNSSDAQPWFPTLGAATLLAGKTYRFKGLLHVSRSGGANSHTTSLLFGGTATVESIFCHAKVGTGDAISNAALNRTHINDVAGAVVKAASTSTSEQVVIEVEGVVRISASGTFIPQFKYSAAPGGTPTVKKNSFFELVEIGSSTINAIGAWS